MTNKQSLTWFAIGMVCVLGGLAWMCVPAALIVFGIFCLVGATYGPQNQTVDETVNQSEQSETPEQEC